MKAFNNKIIMKIVNREPVFGDYQDKDEVKLGAVVFPFKGKIDDEPIELNQGTEIYFQYGTDVKIEGEEYTLVSASNILCQK